MNFCRIRENFFPLGKSPLCTLFWEKCWRLETLTFKSPFLKEYQEQLKNIFLDLLGALKVFAEV